MELSRSFPIAKIEVMLGATETGDAMVVVNGQRWNPGDVIEKLTHHESIALVLRAVSTIHLAMAQAESKPVIQMAAGMPPTVH